MISSVEFALALVAVLCLAVVDTPPIDQLRAALAARWQVAPDRIHIDADSTRLIALANAKGELRVGGVLPDGRVLIADADERHVWVRAGVYVHTPVAARDLARGATVDSTAVRIEDRVSWGGEHPRHALPLGWVTARSVRAGDPLLAPVVSMPVAVRAGEDVRAFWTRGVVRLEVEARAAGTGAIGDTVAVRTASGRRVQAVVSAPREVVLVGGGGTF